MKGLLKNILNHPKSSIYLTVKKFGPPEWVIVKKGDRDE